jgi:murein L,D-transpeptidase YcbB/YkuD
MGIRGHAWLAGLAVSAMAVQAALAEPPQAAAQPLPPQLPVQSASQSAVPAASDAFRPTETEDSDPLFGPETLNRTLGALQFHEEIVQRGGWRRLAEGARGLKQGQRGPHVLALKERLAISGDLDNANAASDTFDAATTEALRRFQSRHGLTRTGAVGRLTFAALNVPAEVRLKQLHASAERLRHNVFRFEKRYVVVNIPGAVVEAVANGKVERRHLAVVGRKERPSPVIAARINQVVVNPTWTVPTSIIRNDIVPAVRKDPAYLFKHNLRTLTWKGEEFDPNQVDWSGRKAPNFLLRQDPGPANSLGQLKIDMPNGEAVYLHDTPKKELFRSDLRFHSSGCARVSDVRDLAAWLLAEQGVDRSEIDRQIEAGETAEIKLRRHVPIAWVYLTAWGDGTGLVQFREDIYGLDTPEGIQATTLDGKKRKRPAAPEPQVSSRPQASRAVRTAASDRPAADPAVTGSVRPQQAVPRPPASVPPPRP